MPHALSFRAGIFFPPLRCHRPPTHTPHPSLRVSLTRIYYTNACYNNSDSCLMDYASTLLFFPPPPLSRRSREFPTHSTTVFFSFALFSSGFFRRPRQNTPISDPLAAGPPRDRPCAYVARDVSVLYRENFRSDRLAKRVGFLF